MCSVYWLPFLNRSSFCFQNSSLFFAGYQKFSRLGLILVHMAVRLHLITADRTFYFKMGGGMTEIRIKVQKVDNRCSSHSFWYIGWFLVRWLIGKVTITALVLPQPLPFRLRLNDKMAKFAARADGADQKLWPKHRLLTFDTLIHTLICHKISLPF